MSPVASALPRLRAAPEPLPRDLVDRPRLVDALVAATDVRVVVIGAAAGYGKTTLLRQWEHSDPRRFARPSGGAARVERALRTAAVVVLDESDALRDPAVLRAIAD